MGLGGNIFITGGTGFLGRAILRRAARDNWSAQFTVFSRDEYKQAQCKRRYQNARYVLGDIRDEERLTLAMAGHDIVIHTAAVKFIPEAEFNVSECIDVNVEGSRNVIRSARRANVEFVIGISTDKACAPVNTYGMTKALMERLFGEAASASSTRYVCCRYGNVIGSTGSVIPLFKQQLIDYGEITLTNPYMTRYFITADEAIDIILKSFRVENGAIVIPTPRAMEIGQLAAAIMGPNDSIKTIGIRPGEKMHEKMIHASESVRAKPFEESGYELLRVGSDNNWLAPFELQSDSAAMIKPYEMQDLIEDASYV